MKDESLGFIAYHSPEQECWTDCRCVIHIIYDSGTVQYFGQSFAIGPGHPGKWTETLEMLVTRKDG